MTGCTYDLTLKADPNSIKYEKAEYEKLDSDGKKAEWELYEPECDKFYKSDAYSDKETYGYALCCEMFNDCGTSGWVIFLIIVLVLGILAGGAAAFYFFYWKRKYGGKEEVVEENTESSENSKLSLRFQLELIEHVVINKCFLVFNSYLGSFLFNPSYSK